MQEVNQQCHYYALKSKYQTKKTGKVTKNDQVYPRNKR